MDEVAEPRGLNFMSRSPTGVKRKDVKRKEYQPKSKRRTKLEYEVIDEDWGITSSMPTNTWSKSLLMITGLLYQMETAGRSSI